MEKIKIGIIGGSGYGGSELLRFLLFRDDVEIIAVTSRKNKGKLISDVHQNLHGLTELKFTDNNVEEIAATADVVFFATPNGVAMNEVPKIIGKTKIIDLSGDFRVKDPKLYEKYYKKKHACPELLDKFVYGLPEFNRDAIKKAQNVSNPGCFPTGALLALLPIVKEKGPKEIIIDSKTGSSGSGAEPTFVTHHPERAADMRAYGLFSHQHYPEISQELGRDVVFTPHSMPTVRGIFTTAYAILKDKIKKEELLEIYKKYYGNEGFIRLVDNPRCAVVNGTNFCDIGLACSGNTVIVTSAIDNLVKGDSGQAIQNMNLMFGLDEKKGLMFPGTHP